MADGGTPLLRANHAWFVIDGAISIVAADDPIELASRRDRVAKRARDDVLRDEADACGWSSAIPERSLALRRRRGPASSSSSHGATIVVAEEKQGCRREEAALALDVASAEGEAEETWVGSGGEEYYFLAVL